MTALGPPTGPAPSDVTIVGGGLAGVRTVQSLRRHGFTGSITLLAAEPHLPYDRPPLSKKIITGEVEAHEILLCDHDQLAALRIDLRTESRVAGLNTETKRLRLSDGTECVYRKLVIAAGAKPKVLPGQPSLSHVFVLRTVDDSLRLREAAKSAQHACVIGGGVLGAEIAASLRFHGIDVTIIEAATGMLARTLGTSAVAARVLELHEAAGVTVRLSTAVESLLGEQAVTGVRLTDGTTLMADLVVIALGVTPETDWLVGSGLDLDDGIVTDEQLRTSSPDVFALGDIVRVVDHGRGTRERPEQWTSAVEQADVVARNLMAGADGELSAHVPAPYVWSDQHGERIQTIGRVLGAESEVVIPHPEHPHRLLSLFGTGGIFVGAAAIGMPRPIARLRPMLAVGASFSDAVALGRSFG
jgi:3-phenylpropionate/trans-cinnamate dioxygenase ferredoxin reductase component